MFRTLSLSVAISFFAGLSQLQADDPPATPSADDKKSLPVTETLPVVELPVGLFRSVRIVRDLAAFTLSNLSSQKEGAWIVAGIHPGGLSGALSLQGSNIQAETGKVIDSGIRPKSVILVGGQWKRLELLSSKAPREGRYHWKAPYRIRDFDRNFNIYDSYSVFTVPKTSGTVICRFFENRSGAEQFSSVTSIPDDWTPFLKPAYEYHVRHSADLANSDLNGLMKLVSGDNPFIALTAIRHVLDRATRDEEFDQIADLASSLPKYRKAVLTFCLLKKNDDKSHEIILKAISRSKTATELTGIALGMESWTASQGRRTFLFDPGATRNLRDKVVERWQSYYPATTDEKPWKTWHSILVEPSIQERKKTN